MATQLRSAPASPLEPGGQVTRLAVLDEYPIQTVGITAALAASDTIRVVLSAASSGCPHRRAASGER